MALILIHLFWDGIIFPPQNHNASYVKKRNLSLSLSGGFTRDHLQSEGRNTTGRTKVCVYPAMGHWGKAEVFSSASGTLTNNDLKISVKYLRISSNAE